MNEFDNKASSWDANPMHLERSKAIAQSLKEMVPLHGKMNVMEFGAGTGLLSLELHEIFTSVVLIDNSKEMVKLIQDKIISRNIQNMAAYRVDLEHEEFSGSFDLIYTQMVFHHVADIDGILQKFHSMLNPGGYLAIADLYPEDGSFHDPDFTGHRGFAVDRLAETVAKHGYTEIAHKQCFVIRKPGKGSAIMEYPVFLMTARA